MSDTRSYAGRDLEAMVFARRYHAWILEMFEPYLGKQIAEVGAGSGNFSRMLLSRGEHSLLAIEPSPEMFRRLAVWAASESRVRVHHGDLGSSDAMQQAVDSVVYVNVLEHIENDTAELEIAHAALKPGGSLLLYVPALSFLYSDFDRRIGHYRRYHKDALKSLVESTGFRVDSCRYVDVLGVLPWLLSMRLLRGDLSPRAVALYDRFGTPVTRWLEGMVPPPVGKNLALIGRKADANHSDEQQSR